MEEKVRTSTKGEREREIPSLYFYILHPLDLQKSAQSSQEANGKVKGHDGCDEIFLQPRSEAETAELIPCRRRTVRKV